MRHQVAVTSSSPSYSLVLHFVLLYFHGTPSVLFFLAGRSFGTANCERQSQRVTKGGINVTFENFSKALSTVHVSKNSPMRLSTNTLHNLWNNYYDKKEYSTYHINPHSLVNRFFIEKSEPSSEVTFRSYYQYLKEICFNATKQDHDINNSQYQFW